MKRILAFVCCLLVSTIVFSQDKEKSGYGIQSDSTESDYKNQDAIGGPKSVGAQLKADNQKKEAYFRLPIKVTNGWYTWKKKLAQDYGLQLGINYTTVFMQSSHVLDESQNEAKASSGIFDFQLGWNLVGRKSGKNKGTLFLKVNNRHSYDNNKTAPMFHGLFESGYVGLPAVGFNNYDTRILELNWQQGFWDDKFQFVVGKIDPTNYLNFHGLVIPWSSFLGFGASLSGTVNWPNQGLGAVASYRITDNWYAMGLVSDVYGDLLKDNDYLDFGRNVFDGNLFKSVEAGWVPSMDQRYFKKISLTYWHSDAYVNPAGSSIESGSGWAFSSHWFFDNKYAPYVRFASSNGNGENAFYKNDIQIGNAFLFKSHDLVGLSFSSAEVGGVEKRQMTAELYYRFHLTEHLAVTPDVQWIINPAGNPNRNDLWYYGIRGRVTF